MMKKQAGFTLIELTIVISIIGIILSVAIPAYQKATSGSSANIDTSIRSYSADGGSGKVVSSSKCVNGFLFSTDKNGVERPATDAESKAVKC